MKVILTLKTTIEADDLKTLLGWVYEAMEELQSTAQQFGSCDSIEIEGLKVE